MHVQEAYGGPESDRARSRTIEDFQTNRYDDDTDTLELTAPQADAFRALRDEYGEFFSNPTTEFGLRPSAITDPARVSVPAIVHLCYGYPGGAALQHNYTYPELLDRLMETRIAGFTVEFGRSDYDPAILAPYRDRLIMFGCIDPGDTPAPTVETVPSTGTMGV